MSYSLKQKLGVILFDLLRYEKGLRGSSPASLHPKWVEICNRNESLERAPEGPGVLCLWKWTSDLHAPKVFPSLGLRLMKRAFQDWAVVFQDETPLLRDDVQVSFIIGHRGIERLPNLVATLKSIAGQRDVSTECIVVEQSETPQIKKVLPSWVLYIHTPLPEASMPYSRSWAFNVGARAAKGDVMVLHDNDLLAPQDYAAHIFRHYSEGYEIINLKRFIFYFSKLPSEKVFSCKSLVLDAAPEVIMQNAEAGGSLAVSRKVYFEIGGFDESFVGWGGEDNEFWERAQSKKVWPYGYIPLVHLWHQAQPEKSEKKMASLDLVARRSIIPAEQRNKELAARDFGNMEQLDPPYKP
jgi:hypothetical protein